MAVSPEFWARELRTRSGQDGKVPVDLDAIMREYKVRFDEVPLDGPLGVCIRSGGRVGILIGEGQEAGQRRFTIAHELGHFALPGHEKLRHECLEADMAAPDARAPEAAANEFAAELLMPRKAFAAELQTALPSIALARSLSVSERFDVSLTACARRLVELSQEPSVLMCFENGKLRWQVRSKGFRYRLPTRGSAPPPGSAAADACQKGTECLKPVSVTEVGWLAESWDCDDLVESALAMPRYNRVLSILTAIRER